MNVELWKLDGKQQNALCESIKLMMSLEDLINLLRADPWSPKELSTKEAVMLKLEAIMANTGVTKLQELSERLTSMDNYCINIILLNLVQNEPQNATAEVQRIANETIKGGA